MEQSKCPKGFKGYHWWDSESNDALIGYRCRDCGETDWHNEHKPDLRSSWLSSRCTIKFKHEYKPVTFVTPLIHEIQKSEVVK